MRTLIATLIALMLFATTPVAAGDFEDGAGIILPLCFGQPFRAT